MIPRRPITIVGGGLAGLTLGIALRRRDVPVVLWEAGRYPRHRVCGEFISGAGPGVLDRLGLRSVLDGAGAFPAQTVQFITGSGRSPVRRLPSPALCLSRHVLDTLFAECFRNLGGDLRENRRWTEKETEGIVRASGRQAHPPRNGWRWFGLKAHAHNVELAADLEMHVSADGYVGVNRIDHGIVNVCGLFRARTGDARQVRGFELLSGQPGSALRERLADAVFDPESFCSVAGLSLQPQRARRAGQCRIGDALTLIPPVTGNGMSMAFESAEMAADPLTSYSRGELAWEAARDRIARDCDRAFGRRLTFARALQWLLFSPMAQSPVAPILLRSDRLWDCLFAKTR